MEVAGVSVIDTFKVATGRSGKLMLPSKPTTRLPLAAVALVISSRPFSHGVTAPVCTLKAEDTPRLPVNFKRPNTNSPALPVVKRSASMLPFNSPFAVAMEAAMLMMVSAACAALPLSAGSTTRLLPCGDKSSVKDSALVPTGTTLKRPLENAA